MTCRRVAVHEKLCSHTRSAVLCPQAHPVSNETISSRTTASASHFPHSLVHLLVQLLVVSPAALPNSGFRSRLSCRKELFAQPAPCLFIFVGRTQNEGRLVFRRREEGGGVRCFQVEETSPQQCIPCPALMGAPVPSVELPPCSPVRLGGCGRELYPHTLFFHLCRCMSRSST